MIVYHAGLSEIKKFNFNKNGVHFGGIISAYEAALRKCDENQKELMVHKCYLDIKNVLVSDDLGSHEEWLNVIDEAKKNNFDIIKYYNRYEPDTTPSFIVLNEKCISLLSIFSINVSFAEEEIIKKNFL